jgi:SWI2/SNF2 ATPase/Type I restriction enzyme R protein N terminus (HSDR_N)/Type I restriction modification DNA specificity domain
MSIAEFLDRETGKIDALVEEQQRLIELLKEKRQAVVSHAVTKGLDPNAPMKDSGVDWLGEVPTHWTICQLKRLCLTITDGAHISPETEDGVHCFVSTKDVSDDGIDFEGCLRTSEASFDYLVRTGCRPNVGDVLFSKDGTIGRTVIVRDDIEFVVASSLIIIRSDQELLDPAFLHLLCQSSLVRSQVESFVKGAGLPRLSIQNLLKVIGVFPTREEQLEIVVHLGRVTANIDTLSREAETAIALLNERRGGCLCRRHWQDRRSRPRPRRSRGRMSLHQEISFEDEICGHLAAHNWSYEAGSAAHYDRARALFPSDLIAWIEATQSKAWETLTKTHGAAAEGELLDRVRKQLDDRGTLEVLRHGVDIIGLRHSLALAQFKPALSMNADILARYDSNRPRVVRQVHYSKANENALDLVLFLNGLPVATVELKTDFTQSVQDAIDQYRFDRNPKPKGQNAEPLLSFPSGALVHFAVSSSEVHMTTRLEGPATTFLPFNKGDNGAAGNPPDPNGHPTSYLWEDVWARDSWLEILGRYVVPEKDSKKQIAKFIFPRYHQLEATRKLVAAVREEGAGGKYLIQHSAGSGKTNSIAWTAHFLADLHDAKDQKLFSTVIVVSDRNVIDGQLQDALAAFERTQGVVVTIKSESASKSGQLAQALAQGKKIIVCTIQTFPFALAAVRELAATDGKRFAVIADEAHSSQTGETAAKLKAVLTADELAALQDGGEVSAEDILAAQMTARASEKGITYVAFTATPKTKTLEIFGRRPNPDEPASDANTPEAFTRCGRRSKKVSSSTF